MQATTQEAPAAPVAPATPHVVTTTAEGKSISIAVPQSEGDVAALYSRRQDIRDQIAIQSRTRHGLVEEIRSAPEGVARTGLEQRVTLIDQNILGLEKQLTTISQQLDAAPSELIESSQSPSADHIYQDGYEEGLATGIFTTIAVIAAFVMFRRWRGRKKRKSAPAQADSAESPRMERLEQGMEAIAIEVERISEGQRFVTRLLSETRDREPVQARIPEPAQGTER
jgi:hypothetical protein